MGVPQVDTAELIAHQVAQIDDLNSGILMAEFDWVLRSVYTPMVSVSDDVTVGRRVSLIPIHYPAQSADGITEWQLYLCRIEPSAHDNGKIRFGDESADKEVIILETADAHFQKLKQLNIDSVQHINDCTRTVQCGGTDRHRHHH